MEEEKTEQGGEGRGVIPGFLIWVGGRTVVPIGEKGT